MPHIRQCIIDRADRSLPAMRSTMSPAIEEAFRRGALPAIPANASASGFDYRDGMNVYACAGLNPVVYSDPIGLAKGCACSGNPTPNRPPNRTEIYQHAQDPSHMWAVKWWGKCHETGDDISLCCKLMCEDTICQTTKYIQPTVHANPDQTVTIDWVVGDMEDDCCGRGHRDDVYPFTQIPMVPAPPYDPG